MAFATEFRRTLLAEIRQQIRDEQQGSAAWWESMQRQLFARIREECKQATAVSVAQWEKHMFEHLQVIQATRAMVETTAEQLQTIQSYILHDMDTVAELPPQQSPRAGSPGAPGTASGTVSLQLPVARATSAATADTRSVPLRTNSTYSKIGGESPSQSAFVFSNDVHAFQAAHGWIVKGGTGSQSAAGRKKASNYLLRATGLSASACLAQIEKASMVLILANLAFMGVDASIAMISMRKEVPKPVWIDIIEVIFAVAFVVELTLKIGLEGREFFLGPNKKWNIFDLVLGISPLLDIVLSVTNLSFMRSLKAFRAIRAARMIKGISFVRELRLMVASILSSLVSLLWAMVLMLLLLYTFSLFIMQVVETHAVSEGQGSLHADTLRYYGTLYDSMLSLFMAISGGMDWYDLVKPLELISKWYVVCFVIYVIFVLFGVMNILTAIFVESAGSIAEIDRDLVIQESIARETSTINAIKAIFQSTDKEGSGYLSKSMLEKQLTDDETLANLKIIGLDVSKTRGLFQLLDIDDKDFVEIEEFVCGMMRLRGTGVDIATVMYENKRILTRLTAFMRFVEDHMSKLESKQNITATKGMHQYVSDAVRQAPRGQDITATLGFQRYRPDL